MASDRRFLVLHGRQNRRVPPGHWQWQLVEALRSRGEQALHPQFPDPDRPDPDMWSELLVAELAQLGGAAARTTRLVAADDDPHCPEGVHAAYGDLQLDTDIICGGAHLDLDAGYGNWPGVLAWCLEPDRRVIGRGPKG